MTTRVASRTQPFACSILRALEITFRNYTVEREGVALADWLPAKKYLAKDEMSSNRLGAKLSLAIDPMYLASRIAAQRSRSIFGKELEGLENADDESKKPLLAKIPIDGKAIGKIKAELKTCGISESTVFADLEGLGRELRWWWTTQCPLETLAIMPGSRAIWELAFGIQGSRLIWNILGVTWMA